MLTSIFLSFLGGLGIFLIFLSVAAKRKLGGFERIERLTEETRRGGSQGAHDVGAIYARKRLF